MSSRGICPLSHLEERGHGFGERFVALCRVKRSGLSYVAFISRRSFFYRLVLLH
jgi:hypothetical protein